MNWPSGGMRNRRLLAQSQDLRGNAGIEPQLGDVENRVEDRGNEVLGREVVGGRFAAVVDSRAQAARGSALALGAAVWSESFERLLSDHAAAFDAVILSAPGTAQPSLCKQAALAGKRRAEAA